MVDMWTTEILYSASSQLTVARTPTELLDAAIVYARVRGATCAQLIYMTGDGIRVPLRGQVMAEWSAPNDKANEPAGFCLPFADPLDDTARVWMQTPDEPFLVSDVARDPRLSEHMRAQCTEHLQVSVAVLPLHNQDRWVGALVYGWSKPYTFTDRDARIFTAVIRNVAPAIDSIRLMEDSRERALRAEYLLKVSDALQRATDEAAILHAIGMYTDRQGADILALNYVADEADDPFAYEPIARRENGEIFYYRDDQVPTARLANYGIKDLWQREPDQVLFIENIAHETRLTQAQRDGIIADTAVRALCILPLRAGGAFQGLFGLVWMQPHRFNDQEYYVYGQLQQMLPAVVASRRAYLAEQAARAEIEWLYRAGESINAAHTFEDVLTSLAALPLGGDYVALSLASTFDVRTSTRSHWLRRTQVNGAFTHEELENADYPVSGPITRLKQFVSEDTQSDPRLDEQSRATYHRLDIRSVADVALRLGDRTLGYFITYDTIPRQYSRQQRRLIDGLGDLVANAVERIRLQMESDRARQRVEVVSALNAALLRAVDETAIIQAIADVMIQFGADMAGMNYAVGDDVRSASLSDSSERIVRWEKDAGIHFYKDDEEERPRFTQFGIPTLWSAEPSKILYIEDIAAETRLSQDNRSAFQAAVKTRATAVIPLFTGAAFQGLVAVHFFAPHSFSADERYLYEQLQQVLPAVVASRRAYLAEQAAREESEILYRAGEDINAAYAFDDLLDVVARLPMTVTGVVLSLFENFNAENAQHLDVLARRTGYDTVVLDRLTLERIPRIREYARLEFYASDDVANDETIDPVTRETYTRLGIRALLSIPLRLGERTMGFLSFLEDKPRSFTRRQQRLAAGVGDLVATAVERIRLQAATDLSRQRAEWRSRLNAALLHASNEAEIVQVVVPFCTNFGASIIGLTYAVDDHVTDVSSPQGYYRVARWIQPDRMILDRETLDKEPRLAQYGVGKLWAAKTQQITYIEDYATDKRLSADNRKKLKANISFRASAIIPLIASGTFHGMLGIHWVEAHLFTDEERYFFEQLRQVMPAVVASRRAYLAEQSVRRESEILYRASEAINAAYTYEDVLNAIAQLPLSIDGTALSLYENYDSEGATYVDFLARRLNDASFVRERITADQFPLMDEYAHVQFVSVEDVLNEPDIDDATQATFARRSVRSYLGVSLRTGGRSLGLLIFFDTVPRRFTPQQRRLAAGMGDLVVNAVERIRLQTETDQARRRAETLSLVNAALLQSADEAQILEAIAHYASERGADGVSLYYGVEGAAGNAAEPVARWQDEHVAYHRDDPIPALESLGVSQIFGLQPDRVWFVEDICCDLRISQEQRTRMLTQTPVRSLVVIPLYTTGSFQGAVALTYHDTHVFSDEESKIYGQLQQVLPPVVATRRAYLAEQSARYENETLFRAGKAINAANTFEDVLAAVAGLNPPSAWISIGVFEGMDERRATYIDFYARSVTSERAFRDRRSLDSFPIVRTLPPNGMVVISDTQDPAQVDEPSRQAYASWEVASAMAASLMVGQQYIGIVTFHDFKPRTYTAQEQHIAMGVADLVANALDRIALRMQADAARYRAETLSQLHAALSRAKDEASIMAALAPYAEARGITTMVLRYVDLTATDFPRRAWTVATWRVGEISKLDEPVDYDSMPYFDHKWWNDGMNQVFYVSDLATEERMSPELRQRFLRAYSAQAFAALPLVSGGIIQGALGLYWDRPHLFTDDERYIFAQLLQTLPVVVATRRALLGEQQRAQQLEAVAKVSAAVSSSLTKDVLLRTVTQLAQGGFENLHFSLFLLDEGTRTLVLQTMGGADPDMCSISLTETTSLVAEAARTLRAVYVDDMAAAEQYVLRPFFSGARSEMAVPMTVGSYLIGVLDVQANVVQHYTHAEVLVMHTLADLLAVAIQNIRLYEQAQEAAAYEERNRLARELHDSVSQALYGIALGARTARALLDRSPERLQGPLDYILSLAEAGLMEMRALIFDLRVDSIQEEGLIAALAKQTASLGARHNIRMLTEFCPEPNLSIDVKEALYWIAREALHNTIKHAQAKCIAVKVATDHEALFLEIVDDGLGFDASSDFPGHLGLKNIRERAARLNGTLDLTSARGKGTAIRVRVPLA